jgi:hypothetical protein
MTERELEEYRALRDTIRERSTARLWITLVGLSVWTVLTLTTAVLAPPPILALLTLLLLVVVFELVFSIHAAVERIGRYIQVFLEDDGAGARWEHTAMGFGRVLNEPPGHVWATAAPLDALFFPIFLVATLLNLIPVMIAAPLPVEWIVIGVVHLLFAVRIVAARRAAGQQRALDLDRFRKLKDGSRQ